MADGNFASSLRFLPCTEWLLLVIIKCCFPLAGAWKFFSHTSGSLGASVRGYTCRPHGLCNFPLFLLPFANAWPPTGPPFKFFGVSSWKIVLPFPVCCGEIYLYSVFELLQFSKLIIFPDQFVCHVMNVLFHIAWFGLTQLPVVCENNYYCLLIFSKSLQN